MEEVKGVKNRRRQTKGGMKRGIKEQENRQEMKGKGRKLRERNLKGGSKGRRRMDQEDKRRKEN